MADNKVDNAKTGFFGILKEVDPIEARLQAQLRVGEDNSNKAKIANSVMSARVNAIENIRIAPALRDNRAELLKIARERDRMGAENAEKEHLAQVHEVATQKPWYVPKLVWKLFH